MGAKQLCGVTSERRKWGKRSSSQLAKSSEHTVVGRSELALG